MLVVKVNSKTKRVPTCWAECTTEQYQKIKAHKSLTLIQVFCILIDEDYDSVATASDRLIESAMYTCCAFVFNEPEYFTQWELPKTVKIGSDSCAYPVNLGSCTIEQNLLVRMHMNSDKTMVLEQLISKALSIYLQPVVDGGRFDADKAKAIEQRILQLPIEQTYPVGFFYLSKLNNSGRSGLLYNLLDKLKTLILRNVLVKRLELEI